MSYFKASTRDDRQVLVPTEWARSGWDANGQIRGTAISGALAMAAEGIAAGLEGASVFRPVRWTLDLFRPAAMIPSTTDATVVRSGRRLRLVDVLFVQEGATVARGSLLLLAAGGAAGGTTWTGPASEVPPVPSLCLAGTERTLFLIRAICLIGKPSARWSRLISAQSSTSITCFLPGSVRARIPGRGVKFRLSHWGQY